jgi:Uma2 family endonuclease
MLPLISLLILPPDLIIEIDLSHPSLDKFPIYAALRVPEVWRYDGQQVHIYRRVETTYIVASASTVSPGVTSAVLDAARTQDNALDHLE